MKNIMIETRDGTKLYIEYCFNGCKNTIIILHGGPGQGCWQFTYLAEMLSKKFNVISFDQRGVLRSDEITYPFHSEMLIDDIEDIRMYFHIDKLIVLGHSYGGQLALRYAVSYPDYANCIIYICPSFNFLYSLQNVYSLSFDILQADNNLLLNKIKNCIDMNDATSLLEHLTDIPESIRNKVYGDYTITQEVKKSINNHSIKESDRRKGINHQQCVFNDQDIYFDYLPVLKDVSCESLLIVGETDPVCNDIQIHDFLESNKNNKAKTVNHSGHSPHIENPTDTVSIIENFIFCQHSNIAYCDLACCVCSENDKCVSCQKWRL
ncbi:MAG: alpha/beta hydrolase [Clostridia bacterium]